MLIKYNVLYNINSAKKDVKLNNILTAEVILLNVLRMRLVVHFVFYTATIQVQLVLLYHRRAPLMWKE